MAYKLLIAQFRVLSWSCTIMVFALFGCYKDSPATYQLKLPVGFPNMVIPADNQLTSDRVQLGKLLFFDKRLSKDSTVACASCHLPQNAFSDDRAISQGVGGGLGFRNAISLGNVGYQPYLFMDGGVPTLELQPFAPIASLVELNFNIPGIINRLSTDTAYQQLSQMAYNRSLDDYVLIRALASFERTFVTGNSRFDQYQYHGNKSALTTSEINGMNLFYSNRTNCSSCHTGFNFTDYSFRDIGLYTTYADSGRARITLLHSDNGKFKVPSLRNAELTAPYMHDGSIPTLEAVVEHFNTGGVGHYNQDTLIHTLNLNKQEKTDLVNFLKSLTDEAFVTDAQFRQ